MIHFNLQKKLAAADGELLLDVSASIGKGEFVCLYGSSGAGKTSVLRMIAGFMNPDAGSIEVSGATWFNKDIALNLPPQRRTAGFVFQDYALFPNMNVRENIAFGPGRSAPADIVDELLELTGLTGFASSRIRHLSGGQQQRVALARAIAKKPPLLLLDEPLSALDHKRRTELQSTLLQLHKRFGLTTILVSHDPDEIIKLADTLLHLENGRFISKQTPADFFAAQNGPRVLIGKVLSVDAEGLATVQIESSIVKLLLPIESVADHSLIKLTVSGGRYFPDNK